MNREHKEKLLSGVETWNNWRKKHYWFAQIDLSETIFRGDVSGIDLRDANLLGVNFSGVCLNGADLRDAKLNAANFEDARLINCDLRGACLDGANFKKADLTRANLGPPDFHDETLKRADIYRISEFITSLRNAYFIGANLEGITAERISAEKANFAGANFKGANLKRANLKGANLNGTTCITSDFNRAALDHSTLVAANLTHANISDCSVYGVSAWDIVLDGANQNNLVITPDGCIPIVTDNIELAQFMYLLLSNKKVRGVIDTISTKLVLILGRFTHERKLILDELRKHIRSIGGIPILFDFEKPKSRDVTETVITLAHLSRLVIADLTDAKSVPQELHATIPNLPSVRFQPICASSDIEYSMFEHFKNYAWVLPTIKYDTLLDLKEKLRNVLLVP